VRSALVIAQVALSLLLMAGAGLMVRSFRALQSVDPGFDPAGVLTFEIALPYSTYDSHAKELEYFRTLSSRINELPGVLSTGVGNYVPLRGDRSCASVYFEGRPSKPGDVPPCTFVATMAPGYFEAMGLRVRGRTPTWHDADVRSDGVVVTKAFAQRYWPNEDALGKGVGPVSNGVFYLVVGIVERAAGDALETPDIEGVFYPVVPVEHAPFWGGGGAMTVLVRTTNRPLTLIPWVRRAMALIDPDVPLANPRSMDQILSHSMQLRTFTMMLLAIAAAMSVVLSAVGLYGVISYIVNQRRSEMGVRLALGARVPQVRMLVMRQSMVLAVIGIALGLAASMAGSRTLATLLYGVKATDPLTLSAVSALLIAVAALAAWIPAARAGRIEPMRVLREE
jgi:putative ABC transport system permease protein